MDYWIHRQGQTYGPYSKRVLRAWHEQGHINDSTNVCPTGGKDWVSFGSLVGGCAADAHGKKGSASRTPVLVTLALLAIIVGAIFGTTGSNIGVLSNNSTDDAPGQVSRGTGDNEQNCNGIARAQEEEIAGDSAAKPVAAAAYQWCMNLESFITDSDTVQKFGLDAAQQCVTKLGCVFARYYALTDGKDADWGSGGNSSVTWQQYAEESAALCPQNATSEDNLDAACAQLYGEIGGHYAGAAGAILTGHKIYFTDAIGNVEAAKMLGQAKRYELLARSLDPSGNYDYVESLCSAVSESGAFSQGDNSLELVRLQCAQDSKE